MKIQFATLRQLLAFRKIMDAAPESGKCGVELHVRQSPGIYAAYFYLDGLEQARRTFHRLRRVVDAEPGLGSETPMLIKRGCTAYELNCGPSDRFTFAPEQEGMEAALLARLRPSMPRTQFPASMTVMSWAQIAFQTGDETYLDITKGRPLYPRGVTYDPGPALTE